MEDIKKNKILFNLAYKLKFALLVPFFNKIKKGQHEISLYPIS